MTYSDTGLESERTSLIDEGNQIKKILSTIIIKLS